MTSIDMLEVLETVARQNAYAYQTILNTLTLAQQRALRLASHEQRPLFQKDLLENYEIKSAPALHSSIKTLKTKGILDEEGTSKGNVLFDDPLFAFWLRLSFPKHAKQKPNDDFTFQQALQKNALTPLP